tara:strand:+ start:3473 stop:4396 length:924 start_codon:yes stop_codon:yes gene_type:complete
LNFNFDLLKQITLTNGDAILIVLNYGAVIQKLLIKDANGNYTNVVVGLEFPSEYLDDDYLLGACIGRFAGRISKSFEIDGVNFPLPNHNGVHLHGGKEGFGKKYWTIEKVEQGDTPYVKLSYVSDHLEEGYPGNLKVSVTYVLKGKTLRVIFEAVTDRTTVVNLTNHSYFKLDSDTSVDNYNLQLNCSKFLETKDNLLPTGRVLATEDSSFDFLSSKRIGKTRLDTPFIVDVKSPIAAKCTSEKSGITLEVASNQLGLIVYTPKDFSAICFETQNLPDAPNQKHFPSATLRPGEHYRNITEFRFTTK